MDSGDRVAIGAIWNGGNGNGAGMLIYEWSEHHGFQDIDGEAAYDRSGHSVSMNAAGDKVAIGATGNDCSPCNGLTSNTNQMH